CCSTSSCPGVTATACWGTSNGSRATAPGRSSPSLPTRCRATGRKRWPPASTATSPSPSTSAPSRTKWLDCFLQLDGAVNGLEVNLAPAPDRKSTRLNSSHDQSSYAVFCLKKKKQKIGSHDNTSPLLDALSHSSYISVTW